MTEMNQTLDETASAAAIERSRGRLRRVALTLHRWAGLAAMLWLTVLGITGFMLNHPEWRWIQQVTVTDVFASKHVLEDEARGTIVRKFQVNPSRPQEILGGGQRGLWRSSDSGERWDPVAYTGADGTPRLFELVPGAGSPWERLYLATDDGIWQVNGAEGPAQFVALRGLHISHLAQGADPYELVGAVGRSRPFRLRLDRPSEVVWLDAGDIDPKALPESISLSRWMTDLHLGFGVAGGGWTRWINDYASLALVMLSITGFLLWLVPRQLRRRKAASNPERLRKTARWAFRGHAPVIGLLAVIPLLGLILSGAYLNHVEALLKWSNQVRLDPITLNAYELDSLRDEINGLVARPGQPAYLAVMTRMGILETEDNGASWRYDAGTPLPAHAKVGFVEMKHRQGHTFVGTHGGPNVYRIDGEDRWREIPGLRMMIQDAALTDQGWIFKGSRGFYRAALSGGLKPVDIRPPDLPGLPLYNFVNDLHSGMVFSEHWSYVNDVVCALALLMIASGLINWWHRRWR